MHKRIAVADLRLGMYLERFEGAWIDHPFWRVRFVVDKPEDLQAAQASGVRECWIDVAQGLDVVPAQRPSGPAEPQAAQHCTAATPAPPPLTQPTALADELNRAAALCRRSHAAVTTMFAEVRMGQALNAQACQSLVQEISESVARNPGALISLARLKTVDDYTYMHSVAVCALMVSLGRTLGLDDTACREAGLAGLLHDMGKALMPSEVLNKPGKLTAGEFAIIRTHPERGWELLRAGRAVSDAVLDVCLHHHERIDGEGYPHRLAGAEFTTIARMGAVCDVYDAITSDRPYKAGWDPAESIAFMARCQGHFDPAVFAAFVKCLGIYPIGSLVRLVSGKLAVVVEQNPQALALPTVKVFFSTKANLPIPVQLLDLTRSKERIAGREPRKDWNFPQIEGLWAGDAVT